jgi:nucleoside phosphorylase
MKEDVAKSSRPLKASDLKGQVHAAIITIRPDEYDAMEARLGELQSVQGNNSYKLADITTLTGERIRVVLTRAVGQGDGKAQAVASNIINELDPAWLLLVGIAGGVPDAEFSLGDVVLATYLHDFSFSAVKEGKTSYEAGGGNMHRDVERFLSTHAVGQDGKKLQQLAGFGTDQSMIVHPKVFPRSIPKNDRYYGSDSHRKKVEETITRRFPKGQRNGGPLVWQGPCANGNLVLKDADLLAQWQQSARQVIHVETELSGVYEAARTAGRENYPVLAVRGLSDIVGFARHADWTGYACETAAAFALAILKSGLVDFSKNLPQNLGSISSIVPTATANNAAVACRADIDRILKYAPAELIGRDDELKLIRDAWMKAVRSEAGRPNVLTFVALGGEGKTSLVAKWVVDEMIAKGWPGCDAAFAWSFYSQGTREQLAASSDLFLKEALAFFGDDADKEFAASPAGAFEKGQRLARVAGQRRSLLILDGLEPLQYPPPPPHHGALKDQGIAALLKGLAQNSHGMCIITTRYSLPDLKAFWQTTAPEAKLLRLSRSAGVHLLKTLGVKGSPSRNLPLKDGDQNSEKVNEFEKLVEYVQGHALTLTLLGSYLHEAHGGDIRKRDQVKIEEADDEIEVIPDHANHAFHVMDAYAKWFEKGGKTDEEKKKGQRALALLRLMGLFDRPATADCLQALWSGTPIAMLTEALIGLTRAQRNIGLTTLENAKLLTVNRDAARSLVSLDAHPHIRAYFAKQLREKNPEAWRAGHKCLYKHLCANTPDKPQPTLEDLQPLYQAVAHGCQAGLQQEAHDDVHLRRIRRGGRENYCIRRLGAYGSDLGALACFFERPWSKPSPKLRKRTQAILLGNTAFRLRALGRLTESREPMREAVVRMVKLQEWRQAALAANNLSELELTLGKMSGAVESAQEAVTHADRSGDTMHRVILRTTHADVLHQAGRRAEAEARFREAEQMQAEWQSFPLLYALQGFQYCDLLLAPLERAAWQAMLALSSQLSVISLEEAGRAVSLRAAQTLKLAEQNDVSLLTSAVDHLTLGRATLYEAVLSGSEVRESQSEIEQAVSGLRRAGAQEFLLHGLVTRAWFRFLIGTRTGPDSSQADLDEAWEIAERGPMRLHMAGIHLYRARLFFRDASYPWDSPTDDLAAARKLIEQCEYWRRKEELEDAEAALKQFSGTDA